MDKNKALVVFQGKKIRRAWFNEEWWLSEKIGQLKLIEKFKVLVNILWI